MLNNYTLLYMTNLIEVLSDRLQEVNHTIESKTRVEEVTFEDASMLADFYHEFHNTNEVIDEVEDRAHYNVGALLVCVTKLQGVIRRFLSLDLSVWREVNFVEMEQSHLKAYREKWDKAKDMSTKLWQKYQSESNRLDMMNLGSEEYRILDVQCEQTKLAYDKAHEQTNISYDLFKLEQEHCAHIHYFDIQFLELWATKMMQITEAVRSDAKRLLKETKA